MIGNFISSFFGSDKERQVRKIVPVLREVRQHERALAKLTNDQLRSQTAILKERLSQGASLDDILPEAFSTCAEAAKRVVGMRHFDTQVIGGIVLHRGAIAEMMTGEGKTLVATLPVYLNALTGKGVHLVTVNDYLARRDREWMGPIYEFLGMTVGLIQHDMSNPERQVSYRADITYATNNELGFDYLRDNMAHHPSQWVQRPLNYAIVDEIDSILIDEARTPLIISGRPEKSSDVYVRVDGAIRQMKEGVDYELEEKGNHVILTEDGMSHAEQLLSVENLYANDSLGLVHMIEQALKAHHFFQKDQEYVVKDGQVIIVDEFTGRMQEGRRFSDGLHQALEAKEGVPVHFELQTIASVTYQNYFRLYNKLAGMTGTALTEAGEFATIYNLDVLQIPTNLPMARRDLADLVYATENGKLSGLVKEVIEVQKTGRPVLVGTRSIEMSERIGKMLSKAGVDDYQILNAKYHEREAFIVGAAGKRSAITIATNMAGRGTDIKLGEGVRELGGLAIIGTERHESRRIDNQLRGRCGRQGDPGTTQFYLSLEDEAARLFGGDRVKKVLEFFGGKEQMDEEPLSQRMVTRSIERAQRQWEEYNFEIRKHVKDYDDVMNAQRKAIYAMRRDVLEDKDVRDRIFEFFANSVNDALDTYAPEEDLPENWDYEGLEARFKGLFGFSPKFESEGEGAADALGEDLINQAKEEYDRREQLVADALRASYLDQGGTDDGRIDFTSLARKRMHDWEKMALLRGVDDKWIDHLYTMDYLRESVRLRAYGQKDPLVEYKNEGFEAFQHMFQSIEEYVIQTLFRMTDPEIGLTRDPAKRAAIDPASDPFAQLSQYAMVGAEKQQDTSFSSTDTSRFQLAGKLATEPRFTPGQAAPEEASPERAAPRGPVPVRKTEAQKVKPNDPCPCGSGKKYKKCCGSRA